MNKWWKPAGLILVTLLLAVSVKNDFLYFLLGLEVMLLVAAVFEVRYAAKHLSMEIILPQKEVVLGENFTIRVKCVNDGILPIQNVRVRLALCVFPEKEELLLSGKVMMDRKEEGSLCFTLDSSHCVGIRVRKDRLMVTDYLGILSKQCRIDREESLSLFVLPDKREVGRLFPEEMGAVTSEEGSTNRKGSAFIDESEIRSYEMGDPIKLIHWKISARIDDLMVRELADQTETCLLLYVNLKDRENEECVRRNPDKWDYFMHVLYAFSASLVEKEKMHVVMWVDKEHEKLVRMTVQDVESMKKMLSALLLTDTFSNEDYRTLLMEIDSDGAKETCLEIDLQGNIASR